MRILAFDVGKTQWGVCYKDQAGEESNWFKTNSFTQFYSTAVAQIELWKPEIIVVGRPNRMYNVVLNHSKYIGILCLLAERSMIPLVELADNSARATLFPGKGQKKQLVKQFFPPEMVEDEMDAIILARAWAVLSKEKGDDQSINSEI
jgi:RNase H-fold protein (predicted Holliday junction resolvase)